MVDARKNEIVNSSTAAKLCGYGSDVSSFQEALKQAGCQMGLNIESLSDLKSKPPYLTGDKSIDKDQPPRYENDSQKTANSVNECDLPQDLKNKLEELEIPLDAKVRKAIARHHISQTYGAAAHVERTRATIDNPRGVFLFQLPRQPLEQLGTRGQVRTARDFVGYTIEHIQKMYLHNWQSAVLAFGLEF